MAWEPTRKQRARIAAKLRGLKRSDKTKDRHSHGHACNPREVLTTETVTTANQKNGRK
jgi:hypothetical protein